MEHYEKLGVFYLGRPYDLANRRPEEGLLLYESKDLVTHGLCVGMTGSGKTGLCIGLLEEAAIDHIPSIVIDPKGDMTNLLLTFPDLRPEDFRPWINEDDARKKGVSPDEYAGQQARLWREGLASWGQDGERIRFLKDNAGFVIYTPGSTAGVPVSIIKSFSAPSAAIIEDSELLNDRVQATTSSLLGLIGVQGDPIQSREFILISNILFQAWQQGRDLDLADLIHQINNPPMRQVGVMSLESFYPAKDRFGLALQLNNLLASPGFSTWMQGEALDINRILYTPQGKPKVAIFSINHLSDTERMFFVSLLLNQVLSWTRSQSGTTSLRAILYMDEIFGFFPPVANPPSKKPLLTLLKQARAYGLGIMLTTQNPVDLDYKGLSNIGTWFIGRLQTERDKLRVLDGLEGASFSQNVGFERRAMDEILSGLGQRVFLMHNVHNDAPVIFQTRWCMSYLRGPLTRNQIRLLTEAEPAPAAAPGFVPAPQVPRAVAPPAERARVSSAVPILPPGIQQVFLPPEGRGGETYRPVLVAHAQLGYKDTKAGVQTFKEGLFTAPISDDVFPIRWEAAEALDLDPSRLEVEPPGDVSFAEVPAAAKVTKNYTAWSREMVDWLNRTQAMEIYRSPSLKMYSQPHETEGDFRARLQHHAREHRDQALEKLRQRYASRIKTLEDRVRRSELTVQREKDHVKQQQLQTAISVGSTLLSSFMGRKAVSSTSMTRAVTATRGAGRVMKKQEDVKLAKENVEAYRFQLQKLEEELREETEKLAESINPYTEAFEVIQLRPAKRDVLVKMLALGWMKS